MIEAQLAYVVDALRQMDGRRPRRVDLRPEALRRLERARSRRKAGRTVWNTGGCASWYLDDEGRNTTLWPDHTFRFRRRTRRFDAEQLRAVGLRWPAEPTIELAGRPRPRHRRRQRHRRGHRPGPRPSGAPRCCASTSTEPAPSRPPPPARSAAPPIAGATRVDVADRDAMEALADEVDGRARPARRPRQQRRRGHDRPLHRHVARRLGLDPQHQPRRRRQRLRRLRPADAGSGAGPRREPVLRPRLHADRHRAGLRHDQGRPSSPSRSACGPTGAATAWASPPSAPGVINTPIIDQHPLPWRPGVDARSGAARNGCSGGATGPSRSPPPSSTPSSTTGPSSPSAGRPGPAGPAPLGPLRLQQLLARGSAVVPFRPLVLDVRFAPEDWAQ